MRSESEVRAEFMEIWRVMRECVEHGCRTEGVLPGGLEVKRRAAGLYRRLQEKNDNDPLQVIDWVNLYAIAVNEEKRRRRARCNGPD